MIPASNSASDTSRSRSRDLFRRRSNAKTKTNATQASTMKNALLFLNEPNAAPSLVTFTSAKNSGTMSRGGSSG